MSSFRSLPRNQRTFPQKRNLPREKDREQVHFKNEIGGHLLMMVRLARLQVRHWPSASWHRTVRLLRNRSFLDDIKGRG
ncbi:hypothetical protein TNCV_4141311 [Trichonephila clavipes]|nr:hypothetical protein TNCV_4141311 [Trichonephila clavipes]